MSKRNETKQDVIGLDPVKAIGRATGHCFIGIAEPLAQGVSGGRHRGRRIGGYRLVSSRGDGVVHGKIVLEVRDEQLGGRG